MIQQLVVVSDGLLCLSGDGFTPEQVHALTAHLCVDVFYSFCNLYFMYDFPI